MARVVGDSAVQIHRVYTDTRTLQIGDLFVALKGERYDAHAFLPQAHEAGAVAVVAQAGTIPAGLSGIEVQDTLQALQALARAWRQRMAPSLALIAVTGSNGKTTVTQMIRCILQAWCGDTALATVGNLNNHIGVPLTLLRLRHDDQLTHRAAVVELGMNHPGEIPLLAAMVQPTVGVVINAQREHQEFMHTVDAVAQENGQVLSALRPMGVAVFPALDAYTPTWHELAGAASRSLTFSASDDARDSNCDVRLIRSAWMGSYWDLSMQTPQGELALSLHMAGVHNLHNALAAASAGLAAGAPLEAIAQGLAAFRPVAGRCQHLRLSIRGKMVNVIDDTYNANPDSVRAAIDLLTTLPGPHGLILGDMGEVGEKGPEFHTELGHYAAARQLSTVWTAGELTPHTAQACPGARHFSDVEGLIAALSQWPDCASVLVKGSRFMRMERVVREFQGGVVCC
jgi:UDP-N-acetylmuramoyl-tripeptide--D-alanyl-D-alanine ligase